jgi:quinohemoprotein ethanol dehydrogenase
VPGASGGTVWAPSSFSPQTGLFYVAASIQPSAFVRQETTYTPGKRYTAAGPANPLLGATLHGTLTALDPRTNKIVWQKDMPYTIGRGSGATTTAGGLVFHGEPDGNIQAYDARTGDLLWQFQTGFGAEAPVATYEVDGVQYVAIAAGGNSLTRSPNGDAVWAFALNGRVAPFAAPQPPSRVVEFTGPIDPTNTVNMAEYGFQGTGPSASNPPTNRITLPAGTTVTWTNIGDLSHTATDVNGLFDTGLVGPRGTASVTFNTPGTYTYICLPHPWMSGQVIVTESQIQTVPVLPGQQPGIGQPAGGLPEPGAPAGGAAPAQAGTEEQRTAPDHP